MLNFYNVYSNIHIYIIYIDDIKFCRILYINIYLFLTRPIEKTSISWVCDPDQLHYPKVFAGFCSFKMGFKTFSNEILPFPKWLSHYISNFSWKTNKLVCYIIILLPLVVKILEVINAEGCIQYYPYKEKL